MCKLESSYTINGSYLAITTLRTSEAIPNQAFIQVHSIIAINATSYYTSDSSGSSDWYYIMQVEFKLLGQHSVTVSMSVSNYKELIAELYPTNK